MKYPSLKKFMELNNYVDKVKAKKLLNDIKKQFKNNKSISLYSILQRKIQISTI
jgi:hypothetical protein